MGIIVRHDVSAQILLLVKGVSYLCVCMGSVSVCMWYLWFCVLCFIYFCVLVYAVGIVYFNVTTISGHLHFSQRDARRLMTSSWKCHKATTGAKRSAAILRARAFARWLLRNGMSTMMPTLKRTI